MLRMVQGWPMMVPQNTAPCDWNFRQECSHGAAAGPVSCEWGQVLIAGADDRQSDSQGPLGHDTC